jgi:hypothetical protein
MAFLHLNAGVEKRVRRSNQHLPLIVKQNDSRASAVAASSSAYARSDTAENICTHTIIAELESRPGATAFTFRNQEFRRIKRLKSMDYEKSPSGRLVTGPMRDERLPSSVCALRW